MSSGERGPDRRRLCLFVVCVLAPLVMAVGVAWACVPGSSVRIRPDSGIAGRTATVAGSGFSPAPIQIRWDSATGPVIGNANGPSFTTNVGVPSDARPGVHFVVVTGRSAADDTFVSSPAVFYVVSPSIAVQPAAGLTRGATTVTGSGFAPGVVELRWDSASGPLIGNGRGPEFSSPVTIPEGSVGPHRIFAVGRGPAGESVDVDSADFQVTGSASPLVPLSPPLQDLAGPAIVGPSLSAANVSRTVSRKGEFRLLCGQFMEAGVTGTCSARSARRLVQVGARKGKTRRSAVLKVRSKRFQAQAGRRVMVKFRLSKSSLRTLKAAKKVRMRGSVAARDASGNLTRAAFRFTLKAPRSR